MRFEQESDQNGRFQKEQTKNEIEKKEEEKWRNRKKEDTWKHVNNDIFFQKSDGVKNEEEIQNLNAKQV